MLHQKDLSPIQYKRVCQRDGTPVTWDDIVKGYEYEPGHFVVLTKDDFETAALEKSRAVQVIDFVEAPEVDVRFFDVPYYVTPGKGGEHAYAVLRDALRDSNKLGVSRVMLREVQHLAALGVTGDHIVLTLMRFADELVDAADVTLPKVDKVRSKEVDLAKSLIDQLSSPWNPAQYKDDYRTNLMKVIEAKVKGAAPKLKSTDAPAPSNVVDLMAKLKASLAQHKGPGSASKAKATPKSKRPGKASRKRTSKAA